MKQCKIMKKIIAYICMFAIVITSMSGYQKRVNAATYSITDDKGITYTVGNVTGNILGFICQGAFNNQYFSFAWAPVSDSSLEVTLEVKQDEITVLELDGISGGEAIYVSEFASLKQGDYQLVFTGQGEYTNQVETVELNIMSPNEEFEPSIIKNPRRDANGAVTWDCIYFGSYPQTEVVNLTSDITEATYDSNGDAVVKGVKYRRIKESDATYSTTSTGWYDWTTGGDNNGYHYFKYEPIKWRILSVNGNDAFLLADLGLDDQKYNETCTSVTWENCLLRKFLNNEFLNRAFMESEQSAIYSTNVVNADNPNYGSDGGNDTIDKIYLLSLSEIINANYGFDSDISVCDVARRSKVSEYAYAMGTMKDNSSHFGNCCWWLRSLGSNSYNAAIVYDGGEVHDGGAIVTSISSAVRPVLHLNLSSTNLYSYAGTVCSDDSNDEQESEDITWSDIGEGYSYDDNTNATIVNIQQPEFASERGIYMTVNSGINAISVNGYTESGSAIEGAGAVIYLSALTSKVNEILITTYAGETIAVRIKNENGSDTDYSTLTYTQVGTTDYYVASLNDEFQFQLVQDQGNQMLISPQIATGIKPIYPDFTDATLNGESINQPSGAMIFIDYSLLKNNAYNVFEATSNVDNHRFQIIIKAGKPENGETATSGESETDPTVVFPTDPIESISDIPIETTENITNFPTETELSSGNLLPKPEGLFASNVDNDENSLMFVWGYSPEALYYNLYVNGVLYGRVNNGEKIANSILGLEKGKIYSFQITAVNEYGESEKSVAYVYEMSGVETTTEPVFIPEVIRNLNAIGEVGQISLTWSKASEIDTGIYKIYRRVQDEDNYKLLATINDRNTLSYSDTDVEDGILYEYCITGVNISGGESEKSESVTAHTVVDTDPPVLVKIYPNEASVLTGTVEFSATVYDNVKVTEVVYSYSIDGGTNWIPIMNENSLLIDMQGSNLFTDYEKLKAKLDTTQIDVENIKVKAYAFDAQNNKSSELINSYLIDNKGPEKVEGLSSAVYASKATLSWENVSDTDRDHFILQQKNGDEYYTISSNITKLGYVISGLTPETSYTYRVACVDRYGNLGEWSDDYTIVTTEDTLLPVITALSPQSSRINKNIIFRATAEDDSSIASIKIQVSTDRKDWNEIAATEYTTISTLRVYQTTVSIEGYSEGSIYIRAVACDSSGNESITDDAAPYVEYVVDRTAPEKPKNVLAIGGDGYAEVSWDEVKDNDRDRYFVYRSNSLNGKYTKIASELNKLNYIDRDVIPGNTYFYKISVDDKCNNMSEYSDAVSSVIMVDEQKPEIVSVSPQMGNKISETYPNVKILAQDNCTLKNVTVEYSVNDCEYSVLNSTNDINKYYINITAKIPVNTLIDGDKVAVRISAEDSSGNVSTYKELKYYVDKTAPEIYNLSSVLDDNKMVLTWEDVASNDLSGHKVYCSVNGGSYKLVATRSVNSTGRYSYTETVKEAGKYTYKIVTYDSLFNSSEKYSEEITYVVENKAPTAVIGCLSYIETGIEEYFDASKSIDDENIISYKWDFGDGTTSNEIKAVKKYTKEGNYTVNLTVTDNQGVSSSESIEVVVKARSELGTFNIKVRDDNGAAIPFADIYVDIGSENQKIIYADAYGNASIKVPMGEHLIGMYEKGYLPVKVKVNALANTEREVILTTVEQDVIEGNFDVIPMEFEQIVEAGIDTKDPANQNVYKATVQVTYGKTPITINYIRNDTEIIKYDIPDRTFTTASGEDRVISGITYIPTDDKDNSDIIAIIDIPAQASFLKEFFDVKLHIINNASPDFKLINNQIKLNVPQGMTLMTNLNGAYSADSLVTIDEIKGQEEKTISWVLRGNQQGEYNLSADYNGELADFGANINARFDTTEPIKVYGLDGVKFSVEPDECMYEGAVYFNVGLKNERDVTVNMPRIDINGSITSALLDEQLTGQVEQSIKTNLLKVYIEDELGNRTYYNVNYNNGGVLEENINELKPGCKLVYQYIVYGITDSDDTAYFQKAVIKNFSGLEENIIVETSSVNEYKDNQKLLDELDSKDNYAKHKEAFSSSEALDVFSAEEAFDGNIGTRWMADNNQSNQYVGVNLGGMLNVDHIVIAWEKAYAKSYDIMTSEDGQNYKLQRTITADKNEITSVFLGNVKAQYIKIVCREGKLPYGISIWDIGVFGQPYNKDVIEVERSIEVDPNKDDLNEIEKALKYQMGLVLKEKSVLDGEEVQGPAVNVMGHDLRLLNIQAKVGMNLGKVNWDAAVDTVTKTVRVKAGFNDSENAELVKTSDMCDSTWSEQYKQMKKFYKFVNGGELNTRKDWNDFEKLKGSLNSLGCDLFLNADMSIGGYLEFDYSSGVLKLSEGGIMASAGIGTEIKYPVIQPPLIYLSLGLKGNVKGSIVIDWKTVDIINTNLNFETSVTATAKVVGTIALASVEAGIDSKLAAIIANAENPLTVKMSGNLFAAARLFTKEWRQEKQFLDLQLYPSTSKELRMLYSNNMNEAYANFNDIDRSYLNDDSKTGVDGEISASEYPYNEVKLLNLHNGNKLMLWIGDDSSRHDINRTAVMYSEYKNGKWSDKKILTDDGMAVGNIAVCEEDGKAYVVYQKATKVFSDDVSMSELMQNVDLYMQIYDGNTFSSPVQVTESGNNVYEVIRSVNVENNGLEVIWIENSENDAFLVNGQTNYNKRVYNNDRWSDVEYLSVNLDGSDNFIKEMVKDDNGTLYYIKHIADNDTDILVKNQNNIKKTISSDVNITNLQVINGDLYYIKNGELYSYNGEVEFAEGISGINNFSVISNGTRTVLVSNISNGTGSELYICELNGNKWSDFSKYTNYNKYIRNYSAIFTEDGEIEIVVNALDILDNTEESESIYGSSTLIITEKNDYCDIQLLDVYCDDTDINHGNELPIIVSVYNNSSNDVNDIKACLKDADTGETIGEYNLADVITAGETKDCVIKYNIPQEFRKQHLMIDIISDYEESNYDNNKSESYIGYSDIEISNLHIDVEEKNAIAKATITNCGYENAKDIRINIYKQGIKKECSETFSVGELAVDESKEVSWTLTEDLIDTISDYEYNALIMEALSDSEEINLANNDEKVVFKSLRDSVTPRYDVFIDNEKVATVKEGDTYTLGNAEYGYYLNEKMYPAGYKYKVETEVSFSSVNLLEVKIADGAGIKTSLPSGLRFKADITSDNMQALDEQKAITEGILITADDIFENNYSKLDLNSDYSKINIVNNGWYNNCTGSYCGSIVGINPTNYIRKFVAKAYILINYVDGTSEAVYSDTNTVRSVEYVAKAVRNAGYPNLSLEEKKVIDSYIE